MRDEDVRAEELLRVARESLDDDPMTADPEAVDIGIMPGHLAD